ncbi:MAG: DUF1501 domain-containing protein, partial [Gemmataceae bacterium]|nr:DUF1501 domain-containing protein [Gemmataceae bacterium]
MPADRTATRRDFLRATAAGAAGLTLGAQASGGLRPPLTAGTAKSCIFINLVGGPSHLDTFDPKPDAPGEVRGPFRPIQTRVPGLHLSELFPKLADVADKFTLVRGMHHDGPPVHEAGLQLLNTGRLFRDGPEWPSVGAVAAHLHGCRHGAGNVWGLLPYPGIDTGIAVGCGQTCGWLPGVDCVASAAPSPDRPRATLSFRSSCLLAPHLVLLDFRFVTVNMYSTVFDRVSWDCHAAGGSLATTLDDYREAVAPSFDAMFSHLLFDLEQQGLLDTTLVVATGEFGRTPYLNGSGGRDHWAGCWTA